MVLREILQPKKVKISMPIKETDSSVHKIESSQVLVPYFNRQCDVWPRFRPVEVNGVADTASLLYAC